MWKYIVIASLVFFAVASFVFYKTHTAMTTSSGEVAAIQLQYDAAIAKNKDVYLDETISAYAKMRHEWLVKRKAELEAQKARVESEDAELVQETEELKAKWEALFSEIEKEKESIKEAVKEIASRVDLSAAVEKSGADVEPLDDSDPDIFQKIQTNLQALNEKKDALDTRLKQEEAEVEKRVAHRDTLQEHIAEEEGIAKDRRARISPEELQCHVTVTDPSWDYVIIDHGADAGVVIGSRLAVLRGDKKICELNVTLVEANRSSCDVVYSTLLTGEAVQPGDRVIAVRTTNKEK